MSSPCSHQPHLGIASWASCTSTATTRHPGSYPSVTRYFRRLPKPFSSPDALLLRKSVSGSVSPGSGIVTPHFPQYIAVRGLVVSRVRLFYIYQSTDRLRKNLYKFVSVERRFLSFEQARMSNTFFEKFRTICQNEYVGVCLLA